MKMAPETTYSPYRPKTGEPLIYKGEPIGKVRRVEGSLCWFDYADGADPSLFIWCFRDGLNALFSWPSKSNGRTARC